MRPRRSMSRGVALLLVVLGGGGLVAGCSSSTQGAKVSCTLNSCTTTFDRGADATASVLGVDMKLVAADANTVTVVVGGNQLVVPVDGSQQAGGLSVTVDKVTDKQVVLKVAKA